MKKILFEELKRAIINMLLKVVWRVVTAYSG